MTKVKVLIEGYAKKIRDGWFASSTVTLVQSNGKYIIVDPGCNKEKLLEELKFNYLKTRDIDYVFLTHTHTDHALLAGIFENAKIVDDSEIYDGDKQTAHHGAIPQTDIKIIPTPGHDQFHAALIVPTDKGIYAIAGDVFWWQDNEGQEKDYQGLLNHPDIYVKDKQALIKSRQKILKIADHIIPGHGKAFKKNH